MSCWPVIQYNCIRDLSWPGREIGRATALKNWSNLALVKGGNNIMDSGFLTDLPDRGALLGVIAISSVAPLEFVSASA